METWATVALVLGSNIIIGLSTFFATKIQVSHADRRFSIELQIAQQRELEARNKELRERRREVRSEPLLKLRTELARMAVKESQLTGVAYRQHMLKDVISPEELKRQLHEAIKNRDDYLESGILQQVLNMQTDQELINRVEKIMEDYQSSYFTAEHYTQFGEKGREKGIEVFETNKARIIEVQELINKRLEEL